MPANSSASRQLARTLQAWLTWSIEKDDRKLQPPGQCARAGQLVAAPLGRDLRHDLLGHPQLVAPFALDLRRLLVGGVHSELAAEARFRGGEVEVGDSGGLSRQATVIPSYAHWAGVAGVYSTEC